MNLENAKRGYNEVMLVKKENTNYNPNLPESQETLNLSKLKTAKVSMMNFIRRSKKSLPNKRILKLYKISLVFVMILSHQNISPTLHSLMQKEIR